MINKNKIDISSERSFYYRVIHVDTEGGPFVAGGNGVYINTLIREQAKNWFNQDKFIGLILPAYHPIGRTFPTEGKKRITFTTEIYTPEGIKERVVITAWKESKNNIDYFYLEPDKNHQNYFMTQADEKGNIFGIRTIPPEFTPIQNENKAYIKEIEKQLFHEKDNDLFQIRRKILREEFALIQKDELINYINIRIRLQLAHDNLQSVFEGKTKEISLYMRNAHYHEISGALINFLLKDHNKIDVIHTHDYGNTARYIKEKIAKINTFHSDPGQGILPYYIKEKLGVDATQRGDGLINHHIVYAVSEPYAKWLEKPQYSNSHYTGAMAARGRTDCVISIADTTLHGFHQMNSKIIGYCTEDTFKKMEVYEKKQLAKNILANELKKINHDFIFDPNKKTLLFLSRISPAKGSDFIEDIIQFGEKNNCNVIICGFHGFEESEKLTERLRTSYPHIPILIGKEDQAKLGCLHRAASDISVGVSLEEAFGLFYSESLLYGSMCVLSDVGGSRNAVLNKNLCGVAFPLFKGKHEHYASLQERLCQIKNSLQEAEELNLDQKTVASLQKDKNKIEGEIYRDFILCMPEIKKELSEKRDKLIHYLVHLNQEGEQDLNHSSVDFLKEIAKLEKNLQEVEDRVNYVNKLDKRRTAESLIEGLEKALKIISAAPELANYIYDLSQEAFTQKKWTANIEQVYRSAEMMNKSLTVLGSEQFKQGIFNFKFPEKNIVVSSHISCKI